jgi:hypothetical protein
VYGSVRSSFAIGRAVRVAWRETVERVRRGTHAVDPEATSDVVVAIGKAGPAGVRGGAIEATRPDRQTGKFTGEFEQ